MKRLIERGTKAKEFKLTRGSNFFSIEFACLRRDTCSFVPSLLFAARPTPSQAERQRVLELIRSDVTIYIVIERVLSVTRMSVGTRARRGVFPIVCLKRGSGNDAVRLPVQACSAFFELKAVFHQSHRSCSRRDIRKTAWQGFCLICNSADPIRSN